MRRSVERRVTQQMAEVEAAKPKGKLRSLKAGWKQGGSAGAARVGYAVESGTVVMGDATEGDPASDPHVVLQLFAEMARSELQLGLEAERRLSQGVPLLSANLEEGPALWNGLRKILTGPRAGAALRSMHALGLLDLLIPEFHGIDSLVIRDAYHRYTVDEHTFVLIDTLHGLLGPRPGEALGEWPGRFAPILRDLPHPDLLFLAALLHDTGKGRSTGDHTLESARMAENVLARLELDAYETGMVLSLIRQHLEMSAALRRDIFDAETVRTFAAKVQTPEALRMLTLFTYADLNAVHPDALTPWKAENLWRLYIAASNYLDRSVDEERVGRRETELGGSCGLDPTGKSGGGGGVSGGISGAVCADADDGAGADALPDDDAVRGGSSSVTFSIRARGERADAGDGGPAAAVCDDGGGAGRVGDEYRDGGCVFGSEGRGGGQLSVCGQLPDAGDE